MRFIPGGTADPIAISLDRVPSPWPFWPLAATAPPPVTAGNLEQSASKKVTLGRSKAGLSSYSLA